MSGRESEIKSVCVREDGLSYVSHKTNTPFLSIFSIKETKLKDLIASSLQITDDDDNDSNDSNDLTINVRFDNFEAKIDESYTISNKEMHTIIKLSKNSSKNISTIRL